MQLTVQCLLWCPWALCSSLIWCKCTRTLEASSVQELDNTRRQFMGYLIYLPTTVQVRAVCNALDALEKQVDRLL